MGDIKPNLDIRKRQLQIKRSELLLNIERMDLRKLELDVERSKIDENMEATKKVIADLDKEI